MRQSTVLPDDARRKLGSIAGLLGSDFPGERSSAAEAATKLLRQHGLTWRCLVDRAFAAPTVITIRVPEPSHYDPPPWRAQLRECHLHADRLSDWERGFIANLRQWRGQLSPRQMAVLSRLHAKVA